MYYDSNLINFLKKTYWPTVLIFRGSATQNLIPSFFSLVEWKIISARYCWLYLDIAPAFFCKVATLRNTFPHRSSCMVRKVNPCNKIIVDKKMQKKKNNSPFTIRRPTGCARPKMFTAEHLYTPASLPFKFCKRKVSPETNDWLIFVWLCNLLQTTVGLGLPIESFRSEFTANL